MPFSKTRKILQRGDRASQPAAGSVQVGTLYHVTDEFLVERSNGSTWDAWSGHGVTTVTTTGDIDDLDFGANTVIRMNNASDATIRGLVAGYDGQIVTIQSIGAGVVYLAHQNTGSSAANRLINAATSGKTPIFGGSATYWYDGTTARWRLATHIPGAFITVAYSGGDFTAATGSWTVGAGDLFALAYQVTGKTMTVTFAIQTTDVTATPGNLQMAIPGGFSSAIEGRMTIQRRDAGTYGTGLARVVGTGTTIIFYSSTALAAWSMTASANTDVWGLMQFEVT